MNGAWFGARRLVGMVAPALLLGAVLVPVVNAQSSSDAYAALAGDWAGYVTGPSGTSSETIWRIQPDGTFSVQNNRYTSVGSLASRGGGAYVFSYQRDGETYSGTLTDQVSNGVARLSGSGEGPNGPLDITLTR